MSSGILRALRHRNYRLFFFGQGLSLVGTWMQQVAMSWLVYRLTGSALLLGVVAFSGQLPTFILAPVAGVLVDKRSRHRILLVTQSLALLQAATLAVLVASGQATTERLVLISLFLGVVSAFDVPARQSFVVEMIDRRDDLPNALALHSTIFNGARLIGPTVAGIVIALWGEWVCFLLNAASYVPILIALGAMRFGYSSHHTAPHGGVAELLASVPRELREGLGYAYRLVPIRWTLALLALTSVLGMSHTTILPVIAREVLGGGPRTLGFLVGASGLGALAAALVMASRRTVADLAQKIAAACFLYSASLAAFAFSRSTALSLGLMFVTGFGVMVQMVATNTLLQTVVEDRMRGRVMSLYTMALIGMSPFGSLLTGTLAARAGAPGAILFGAAGSALAAAAFASRLGRLQAALPSKELSDF